MQILYLLRFPLSNFAEQIYDILKHKVPAGKVTTYKALAEAVGTKAYRAVGQIMNKNPYSFLSDKRKIPCHRVIASDGGLGGFAYGNQAKINLLKAEGVTIIDGKIPEKYILRKL